MSTTTETIQQPAQPLFVECGGPPILDQDQMLIRIKTPPISDFEEEECIVSDVDSDYYGLNGGRLLEDDESDMTDNLYLPSSSYRSVSSEMNDNSCSSRINSDFGTVEVSNDSVKENPNKKQTSMYLVPVRHPETKMIYNVIVPSEVQDETGTNLIKSILIPINEPDGTVTYDVKRVVVPLKPELNPPPIRSKPTVKSPKSKVPKIKKVESKLSKEANQKEKEEAQGKDEEQGKNEKQEKNEEEKKSDEPKTTEAAEPKEEVDLILANLRTTCPFCQKSFKSEKQMYRHARREHKQPFRCKKCHYTYANQEDLDNHAKDHEKDLECPFCHLKYKRMSGLRSHQIRVHTNVDPVCMRDKAKDNVVKDAEELKTGAVTAKIYVCQHCGNDYDQKSYLIAHKRIAHGIQRRTPKKYQCKVCKRSFVFESSLTSHMSCHDQSYLCAECGREFSTKYALQLHMRKHTGERPYKCKDCQKSFARSVSLRIHRITHTGERPYVCDICEQRFTQRSSMMAHRKKHPGNHPRPPPLYLTKRKKKTE